MAKYAKKRSSKRAKSTKTARAVVKATKYLMLKSVETKYITYGIDHSVEGNDIVSFSPTQQVPVGNTSISRVGDSILLQSLTINTGFHVLATILNAKVRYIVGWTRNQTANTTVADNVLTNNDLFYATSGAMPSVNRIINPAIFTAIYDEVVDINSNTSSGLDVRSSYVNIKLGMKKFDYAAAGGSLGKVRNLVCICTAWVPGATYGVAMGKWNSVFCLKFKDP